MAERLNRDPAYDLARHIRTGEKGPLSGDPVLKQFDTELDRNDPMEDNTVGHGDNFYTSPDANAVRILNDSYGYGLSKQEIGVVHADGQSTLVDMAMASDCHDEPAKGGIAYGPRHTGGS